MLKRIDSLGEDRSQPWVAPSDVGGYRGVIDRIDPAGGVAGWCVDARTPGTPVELELLVNGLAVERVVANTPRSDIGAWLGLPETVGFAFEPGSLDRLLPNRKSLDADAIAVRVADTPFLLSLAAGVAGWAQWLEARAALLEFEDEPAQLPILRRLLEEAAPLLDLPAGLGSATEAGAIEMVAAGSHGLVWFTGWVRRQWVGELSAVVIDRRKFAAGVTMAPYEREDLPPEAVGVVGAILSGWTPSRSSAAAMRLGDASGAFLRTLRPLRVTRLRDILAHLAAAQSAEARAAARQMTALAQMNDGWELAADRIGGAQAAVDQAAGLEGFGIFAKGWILSPARAVKSLTLRLGDRLFPGAPASLYFTPRPDLKSAFPQARDALERAGFCCIFECDAASSQYAAPGLKVTYEDGQVSYHDLPHLVISKIAASGDGGYFREFYPSLDTQPLFARYAEAYYRAFHERFSAFRAEAAERAPTQMLFAAPIERPHLYRLFDDLACRFHGAAGPAPGVTLLAGESARHGEIHFLFEDFRRGFAGACNLAFVADVQHALLALDGVLVTLSARRFVFVGADVELTEQGWRASLDSLVAGAGPVFLATKDPVEPWIEPEASMRAFAWTSEGYLNWRRGRRLPIGRAPSARGFPGASVEPSCGFRIGRQTAEAAVRRINELVAAEA